MKRKNSGKIQERDAQIAVNFWGVRGSIPSPLRAMQSVGGHTACVSIQFGHHTYVCDGGTGMHPLGAALRQKAGPLAIFLSHLHWDHIFGIPFFSPFYQRGRKIVFAGPTYQGDSFRKTFQKVMQPPYFPISPSTWQANIQWKNLKNSPFKLGAVRVEAKEVVHRGKAFGFQFYFPKGKRIVYATDHELLRDKQKFLKWIRSADLLIHDATYDRREYTTHKGWGHTAYEDLLEMAMKAGIKKMVMFHHNPEASDTLLEKRLRLCRLRVRRNKSPLQVVLAKEGMTIFV